MDPVPGGEVVERQQRLDDPAVVGELRRRGSGWDTARSHADYHTTGCDPVEQGRVGVHPADGEERDVLQGVEARFDGVCDGLGAEIPGCAELPIMDGAIIDQRGYWYAVEPSRGARRTGRSGAVRTRAPTRTHVLWR
jgi:hypothetical protein